MVCEACLRQHFGGAEKLCMHGWDMLTRKPRGGACRKCGEQTDALHCPDVVPTEEVRP